MKLENNEKTMKSKTMYNATTYYEYNILAIFISGLHALTGLSLEINTVVSTKVVLQQHKTARNNVNWCCG